MDEIDIPQYFLCPISLQIMRDPVTTVTGITYDRESIEKWLITQNAAVLCPVTKQPLTRASDLTPNHMLRRLIQSWCVANAKNGIDQIPSPKSPLHKSTVLKLVRDLNNGRNVSSNLKKIDEIVNENEKNRKVMAETGVSKAVFRFVLRSYERGETDGLDRALRVIHLTWTSEDNKTVVDDHCNVDKFVESILWILNTREMEDTVKTVALAVLKHVVEVSNCSHMERLKPCFFREIINVLRRRVISPQATKSALQILIQTAPSGRNRAKIVEAGAVFELIEMELAKPSDRRTTELIFCLLAQLCSCADGRQRLLEHGGGVAVVAKRLLRVSSATDDRILCVLEAVARFAATPGVVMEMLRVGGVSKLCMVLQADCEGYLKKKAREILRLHTGVWSGSPCIQLYLLTMYAR